MAWEMITHVVVHQTPTGDIASIMLRGAKKKQLWLFGFEQMETLLDAIRDYAGEHLQWTVKRHRIYFGSPLSGFMLGVSMGAILAAISWGSKQIIELSALLDVGGSSLLRGVFGLFIGVFFLFGGGYFFFAQPNSKISPTYKTRDRLLGVSFVVIASLQIWNGALPVYHYLTAPPLSLRFGIMTSQDGRFVEHRPPDDVYVICNLEPGMFVRYDDGNFVTLRHLDTVPLDIIVGMQLVATLDYDILKRMSPPSILKNNEASNKGLMVEPSNTKWGRILFGSITTTGPVQRYGDGVFLYDHRAGKEFWLVYVDRASHITGTMMLGKKTFSVDIQAESAGFLPVGLSKVKENEYRLQAITLSDDLYFAIRKKAVSQTESTF